MDRMDKQEVARRLRWLANHRRMSAPDIGRNIGSKGYVVGKWLSAEVEPGATKLTALLAAMGCSMVDFERLPTAATSCAACGWVGNDFEANGHACGQAKANDAA